MSDAKLRVLLASAVAMIGPDLLKVVEPNDLVAKSAPKRPERQQRYLGMTDEQRAWNKTVDERKAQKRRAAMSEGGEQA